MGLVTLFCPPMTTGAVELVLQTTGVVIVGISRETVQGREALRRRAARRYQVEHGDQRGQEEQGCFGFHSGFRCLDCCIHPVMRSFGGKRAKKVQKAQVRGRRSEAS